MCWQAGLSNFFIQVPSSNLHKTPQRLRYFRRKKIGVLFKISMVFKIFKKLVSLLQQQLACGFFKQ
jgi:hypothetical protein